jgi:integrase
VWIEKHGPTWRIREEVGARKVTVEGGLPNKTTARRRMQDLSVDRRRGDYIDPRAARTTLGEWLAEWWPAYRASLKPSSEVSAAGLLDRYIRPPFAHQELAAVDTIAVQSWVADLLAGRVGKTGKPLSVKTVRNAHGLLHKVLSEAVKARLIRANPCGSTGLPERQHHEMQFLTPQQCGHLLAEVAPRYRPMIALALTTGLRFGELIGLRVRDVDLLAATPKLTVVQTAQELAGDARMVFVEPKTKAARRTVTFPREVAMDLVPLVANRDGEALVFTAAQGGPVRYRIFWRTVWDPARKAAGLPGVRFHDLRHTAIAQLIAAGVPLTAVSRRVGHTSISVTSDVYGHLMPELDAGIVAAASVLVGGGAGGGTPPRATEINRGQGRTTSRPRSGLVDLPGEWEGFKSPQLHQGSPPINAAQAPHRAGPESSMGGWWGESVRGAPPSDRPLHLTAQPIRLPRGPDRLPHPWVQPGGEVGQAQQRAEYRERQHPVPDALVVIEVCGRREGQRRRWRPRGPGRPRVGCAGRWPARAGRDR